MSISREEILERVQGYLEDLFEIPPADAVLEARLAEDLDLDSIDAVDLIVKLQELTGKKVSPDRFKQVRTVGDVVESIDDILNE